MEKATFSDIEINGQVEKILASDAFLNAPKLAHFLTYIVEESIKDKGDYIKALTIAMNVFDRDLSFDQQSDSIVRMYGGKLRKALDHYYLTVGKEDPIKIIIPKGRYIPTFERNQQEFQHNEAHDGSQKSVDIITSITIAIIQFSNLSHDEDKTYFAAGLSEQLAINLSAFENLKVIGPLNPYKLENSIDLYKEIYNTYQADYLIQGSISSSNDLIKTSIKLIETNSGSISWSKSIRSDLKLENILEVEDNLATEIASRLGCSTGIIAKQQLNRPSQNTQLQTTILKSYQWRTFTTKEKYKELIISLEEADKRDVESAQIKALLSESYLCDVTYNLGICNKPISEIEDLAHGAIRIDDGNIDARRNLGWFYLFKGDLEMSKLEFEKALEINSNDTFLKANYGMFLVAYGDYDNALIHAEKAINLTPHQPGWFPLIQSLAYYYQGDYEMSLAQARNLEMPIVFWVPLIRAAIHGQLGNPNDAKRYLASLQQLQPEFASIGRKLMQYQLFSEENINPLLDGLYKAGMKDSKIK